MKISLSWLNTYLDRPAGADEVEKLLTDQGLPIEQRIASSVDGDVVLDVEVTNNRPDCLSHLGLAREVAAGSGRAVVEPDCTVPESENDPTDSPTRTQVLFPVCNEADDLCPLYTARLIRGVKVAPSPDWLVDRIESIGLRSVNNVVDVTNFVLHELGQPLHAFDLSKLNGGHIVVRRAGNDEPFVAIDGSKHQLGPNMLVIADAQQPVAVAGVMGGVDSEVTDETTDLLLESAIFDPLSVRHTSRALKLASDSSYRFERGVDPLGVAKASRRAAKMIVELAGGVIGSETRAGMDHQPSPVDLEMRVERCNQLLGINLNPKRILELLGRLGLETRLKDEPLRVVCTVPTFRLDLQREVDLIEEVARLQGYDSIPVTEKIGIVASPLRPTIAAGRKLDQILAAYGYHETITLSFVAMKLGEPFLVDHDQPVLLEDIRRAEPMLRPSLLPSLLMCRKSNQDVGNASVQLYETGMSWVRRGDQIIERNRLALVSDAQDAQQGLRDLRGAIEETVLQLTGDDGLTFTSWPSPVCSVAAHVKSRGRDLGWFGLLDPRIQKLFDLQTPVVAGDLDLPLLLEAYPPDRAVAELARFPAVERDLSIIVEEATLWTTIEQQIRNAQLDRLESLRFLGIYRGKPIPPGRKSVAMRLSFRDSSTTLRREQVDAQITRLMGQLGSQFGAELRQ